MSDSIEIKVHGLAELKIKFDKLANDTKNKIARKMVFDGAKEIEKLAKAYVPKKTRNLLNAIKTRKRKDPNAMIIKYVIGYTEGKRAKYDGWYGRLVEFGTKPHRIPKKGSAPKGLKLHGGQIVSSVDHPGAKPRPWLEPAFKAGYMRCIGKMRDTFKTMIEAKYNGS